MVLKPLPLAGEPVPPWREVWGEVKIREVAVGRPFDTKLHLFLQIIKRACFLIN